MPSWVCMLDASNESRARHRADEFINRTVQNPCRDAWELACIEPNRDVKIGTFHGVFAGNLAARDMLEVWNSEPARLERKRARLARRCCGGEVVCLPPRD